MHSTPSEDSYVGRTQSVPLAISRVAKGIRYVVELTPPRHPPLRRWIDLYILDGHQLLKHFAIDPEALEDIIAGLSEARNILGSEEKPLPFGEGVDF